MSVCVGVGVPMKHACVGVYVGVGVPMKRACVGMWGWGYI